MTKWLEAALDYIPSWLELQLKISKQPGCTIAIAYDNKVLLERAFGYADCSRREPLTPRHRFRAASHSKSFTAAGVLKLVEIGKLRLDDPVKKYVSGLDSGIARLKIVQLLYHGAGIIRDGLDCGYFYDRQPYPTAKKLLADFQTPPLIRPDSRFKYSNHGYGLLGLVIEGVTGEVYASWIKREIIDAAGLKETTPDMPLAEGTPFAHGHTDDLLLGQRMVVPGNYSTEALAPASGLVCTAGDLAMFFAQLSPRARTSFISAASRRAMTHSRLRNRDSSVQICYGLGLITGIEDGWIWFGHSGSLQGYVSRTKALPTQSLTVCVLANSADALVEHWINGAIHILRAFKRKGLASKEVKDWSGRWWGLGWAIDLVPMRKVIMVANPHGAKPFLDASELQAMGRDKARVIRSPGFLYYGESVRRVRDNAGQVSELWLGGDKFLPEVERATEIQKGYIPAKNANNIA
jgi:CubicO group peptidase (beta-lactamase class C family)